MDYIAILKADLEKGYSKADLEWLIGLPQNNLSGILKGDRRLSKLSELKIEKWEASQKPNPLELPRIKSEMELVKIKMEAKGISGHRIELSDLTEPTNIVEPQKPLGSKKTNAVINTTNEPKENSMAFFNKYGVNTWEEVETNKTK